MDTPFLSPDAGPADRHPVAAIATPATPAPHTVLLPRDAAAGADPAALPRWTVVQAGAFCMIVDFG
ncbi:MAG: hypothetical protein RLY86_1076 [Pseudomonadota bacterium]|jgi:hypothetical protein